MASPLAHICGRENVAGEHLLDREIRLIYEAVLQAEHLTGKTRDACRSTRGRQTGARSSSRREGCAKCRQARPRVTQARILNENVDKWLIFQGALRSSIIGGVGDRKSTRLNSSHLS